MYPKGSERTSRNHLLCLDTAGSLVRIQYRPQHETPEVSGVSLIPDHGGWSGGAVACHDGIAE
jgi:hypothetical protein